MPEESHLMNDNKKRFLSLLLIYFREDAFWLNFEFLSYVKILLKTHETIIKLHLNYYDVDRLSDVRKPFFNSTEAFDRRSHCGNWKIILGPF